MLSRPAGVSDRDVVDGVRLGWGLDLQSVDWVPLGFGSHHWHGTDTSGAEWFITVDDLDHSICDLSLGRTDTFQRLSGALTVARQARDQGLRFVLAPAPTLDDGSVRRLSYRYALAMYQKVDGTAGSFGDYDSPEDAMQVLDLLIDLHTVSETIGTVAPRDPGKVSRLDVLLAAGDPFSEPWDRGPYGERAQRAVRHAFAALTHHADRHAALWESISSPERLVVTHGEPHPGNTMRTADGWMLLDWDTARVAPPERDLWILVASAPDCLDVYQSRTGRRVLPAGIELYRLAVEPLRRGLRSDAASQCAR